MTNSKRNDKSGNRYRTETSYQGKYISLNDFSRNNYLSRKQIYFLMSKCLIEALTNKGKYYVRWSKNIDKNNYNLFL